VDLEIIVIFNVVICNITVIFTVIIVSLIVLYPCVFLFLLSFFFLLSFLLLFQLISLFLYLFLCLFLFFFLLLLVLFVVIIVVIVIIRITLGTAIAIGITKNDNSYCSISFPDKLYKLYRQTAIAFFFRYHNLHVSASISSCSWYEFCLETLKYMWSNNKCTISMSICANTTLIKTMFSCQDLYLQM
jgi:hypothetical protein